MLAAPSIRVTLLLRFVPLMFVVSARPGVSVCAFWTIGGVAPGTRFMKRLIVAVLVQRQVDDVLRPQVDADVGLVCLEDHRFRLDRHRFTQRPDFQLAVDANDVADDQKDPGLDELLEALERGLQRIGAAGNVSDGIGPGVVGYGGHRESGVLVRDGHGGAGNDCPLRIGDNAGDGAVESLCADGCCDHARSENHCEQGLKGQLAPPNTLSHSFLQNNGIANLPGCH